MSNYTIVNQRCPYKQGPIKPIGYSATFFKQEILCLLDRL